MSGSGFPSTKQVDWTNVQGKMKFRWKEIRQLVCIWSKSERITWLILGEEGKDQVSMYNRDEKGERVTGNIITIETEF